MILILDDVFDRDTCNRLMDFHFSSSAEVKTWRDTFLLEIKEQMPFAYGCAKKVEALIQKHAGAHEIDWVQIVLWPEGSHQAFHFDSASSQTTIASITYLNDSYAGGNTHFWDGTSVAPVAGRTVFFWGQKYKHGVSPVVRGSRFTLPIWYKARSE
jgi:hypothetical protein